MEYYMRYQRYCCQRYFNYYANGNLSASKLCSYLRLANIEISNVDKTPRRSLWFRFFDGDTLVTTIDDLERILVDENDSNLNILSMKEAINICVNFNSLQVYFS